MNSLIEARIDVKKIFVLI